MDEDMDIDASPVLTGMAMEEVGRAIFERMLVVASGEPSGASLPPMAFGPSSGSRYSLMRSMAVR